MKRLLPAATVAALVAAIVLAQDAGEVKAPCPPSEVIAGVEFDWSTHRKEAPGSDNWPITWADDDHQYACWGDGGGFGGTNSLGRVSLGFARIEGGPDDFKGVNVWGGHKGQDPATFQGKSYGIICLDGVLYAWWGPGSGHAFLGDTRLLKSTDHAKTWTKADWGFTRKDRLYGGSFVNFGRDNAGARDDSVYSIFPRGRRWALHKPGRADLARAPKERIMERGAWEWFAGLDEKGSPVWTKELDARKPVFEDINGLRTVSMTYDPGLKRYLLTTQHTKVGTGAGTGNLAIFDAPEPWGPWTTVAYINGWKNGKGEEITGVISFYFAPKWFSADGTDFTLVFTDNDHWGSVRGKFRLRR